MKKNISINISGIIFNIEEDGYEQLKRYLDEIKRYFDTYDDTGEIAADIENRVAEIFLSRLSPQKQVITAQDVESLMVQMGNVQDFEAVEDPEETAGSQNNYQQYSGAGTGEYQGGRTSGNAEAYAEYEEAYTGTHSQRGQRFFRDGNRKVLGGVAAGIARHFGIDPLWIRMLFVIILLDLFMTFFFSSTLLLSYIVIWIIVPERKDIPTEKKVKKVFRNPDDRIIGGVAGGLAAYFGIDPILIRILFFVSTFLGGSGVVAYFVLWLIMPEAKTLTDRMQMQGEPLTLSNIEENIKKNLNFKEGDEKGPVIRAVLFPFRLAAAVMAGAGRALGQLVLLLANTLRVIVGIALVAVGFAFLLALFLAACFASGLIPELYLEVFDLQIPAMLAQQTFPPLLLSAAFISLFIPGLMIMLLGIAVMAKRWLLHSAAGWFLFALWIISLVATAIAAPPFAMNYKVGNFYETQQTFPIAPDQTLIISLHEEDDFDFNDVSLSIDPAREPNVQLKSRFYARGKNKEDAKEIARQSQYPVIQKENTLLLNQHLHIPDEVPFRNQTLKATLYIPVGRKFKLDYSLRKILSYPFSAHGFSGSDLREDRIFSFNENGELICLNCNEKKEISSAGIVKNKIILTFFPFPLIHNKAIGWPF